ncbi:Dihydroflavonol-4-reductase [Dirofilaria immitis]|nr:Dihydroflavonol-4-reductase [Dirofilaria immitis]
MCAKIESTNLKFENNDCQVLVTGASGYLAMHCVQQLLQQGYKVRGTVRDLKCLEKINPLRELANSNRLELFVAAMNCTYVLHIASPCEMIANKRIVETAVCGTLNVLHGIAQIQCVRKVVLTSSCVGYKNRKERFTENDWTNLNWKYLHPYHKSKTLAEQAAWDFMKKIQNTKGSSVTIISRFLDGSMAAYPLMKLGLVDVRDVARAHILAMKDAKVMDKGFLLMLKYYHSERLPMFYAKSLLSKAPYALLWLYARIDNEALQALPLYGHEDNFDNTKASLLLMALKLLDMSYRDVKKSLIEMAYDMIERNILPRKKHAKKKSNNFSQNKIQYHHMIDFIPIKHMRVIFT